MVLALGLRVGFRGGKTEGQISRVGRFCGPSGAIRLRDKKVETMNTCGTCVGKPSERFQLGRFLLDFFG